MPDHRSLLFDTVDEAMAEAERLAAAPTRTSGHYTHGQILEHLARTFDIVSGHTAGPKVAWYMRLFARLIRGSVIHKPAKSGFQLPSGAQLVFWPEEDIPVEQAMNHLRDARRRYDAADPLPSHPFFGKLSRRDSDQLHCRHMALHLGFIHADSSSECG